MTEKMLTGTLRIKSNHAKQYLVISCIGDVYLTCLKTLVSCEFGYLFFTFLPGQTLYMGYPFGHLYGRTNKAQLSSKTRRLEAGFHLNNALNVLQSK